ncbi:hypothetical protein HHI36_016735 [Cryptolaemus montrouzieri]|uniref:Uncharacterized protein n=1 Tax=Cryptolaemus montrouzieri TaxID=559131 RepID=A0ABD2NLB5_9CUCU
MKSDSEKYIRKLALLRVLKEHSEKTQDLRLFQVPEVNMDAKGYYDLISWQAHVTESPILQKICNDELQSLIARGKVNEIDIYVYVATLKQLRDQSNGN